MKKLIGFRKTKQNNGIVIDVFSIQFVFYIWAKRLREVFGHLIFLGIYPIRNVIYMEFDLGPFGFYIFRRFPKECTSW